MLLRKSIFLLLILTVGSCSKNTSELTLNLTKLWQEPSSHSFLTATFSPIIYNEKAIYSWDAKNFTSQRTTPIVAYNKLTGEELWTWSDFFENSENFTTMSKKYQKNNLLVIASSQGNVYCINLDNGTTHWKLPFEAGAKSIFGIDNNVFFTEKILSDKSQRVLSINLDTGEKEVLLTLEEEQTYQPRAKSPTPYKNNNNEIILVLNNGKYSFDSLDAKMNITFFNFTTRTLEKTEEVEKSAGSDNVYVNENKIYFGGENTYCYDAETYELVWENSIPNELGTISGWSGFLFKDEYIYLGSGGTSPKLYCLNKNTGIIIWNKAGFGNTSQILIYEDNIFGINRGKINIVNSQNGDKLLEIESPDYQQNSDAFFDTALSIDPETGKIYTANYISALCYEPYGE